jgi:CheY-like chemotaxis protein
MAILPASGAATAAETRPPRVLIADDNIQGAELLEAYLSDSGYELRK